LRAIGTSLERLFQADEELQTTCIRWRLRYECNTRLASCRTGCDVLATTEKSGEEPKFLAAVSFKKTIEI
jgi:hypothetical protein